MDMAIDAINQGVDGFLKKPFDNVDLRTQIREIQTRKRLRQFVSEEVYREIAVVPDALLPRFQEASILFADIRGFTVMSRNRTPEEIADFLNSYYFGPMGEIIYDHHGVTDKWIGDSIMAVFGAFRHLEDHADNAVKAAVAMQEKAAQINREISQGPFRLEIGIGVASGKVFSGVVGSLRKKEFTSIGIPVILASRLQAIAKAGEIWVSRGTMNLFKEAHGQATPVMLQVKGFEEPIEAYRIR
ncbi:MAG: adenylate/guanylate cyclase domain-containing protein [Thermodesulfobacteriota bacterium]